MFAVPLLRWMRTRSPVLSSAKPPPAAASGDALRIDGEPEVPDCRPSPMHGNDVMPFLINAAGGCMFTTSHEPGSPTGPAPRMSHIVYVSILSDASSMRW